MRRITFIILFASFIGSAQTHATSDSLVMSYMRKMGVPLTYSNKVELLMTGREKFTDLLEAIRHARHHVHLEYFNFHGDSIANFLFGLLVKRVREGVEVRAMFDTSGNWSNSQSLKKYHLQAIKTHGTKIVRLNSITFPYINHAVRRDHHKIVVTDGKTGYTGGMNIADCRINGLPKIGKWHGVHMHIEGDAVHYLQDIFLTMWSRETGQHIGGPAYLPNLPQFPDGIAEETPIVDRTSRETSRSISHTHTASVEAVQRNIQIMNPYFVPTKSIRKAVRKALKKGTEVEIMMPTVSGIPFTPEASFYIVHKLVKRRVKVYLFKDEFHHSKIMMVDNTFCIVDTVSLNSHSLRCDYETNAFTFNPTATNQLDSMFEKNRQNSTLLTLEVWRKRFGWKKLVGWVGNLLTPSL